MECLALSEFKRLTTQSPDKVLIIDVRSPQEYEEKHIPGSINIPLSELENISDELLKNKMIVTICGKGGGRSAQGAEMLVKKGFRSLYLCNGTAGWFDFFTGHLSS